MTLRIFLSATCAMRRWALLALLVVALVNSAAGLYIKLTEGEKRCFIEEVPKDTLIHGTFKAVDLVAQAREPVVRTSPVRLLAVLSDSHRSASLPQ